MKKNKKLDLNVWESQYVRVTLKDSYVEMETEDGTQITKPYTIDGLFIWWDGPSDTVHLNTMNEDVKSISMSLQRSMVAFIEPLPLEGIFKDDNQIVN